VALAGCAGHPLFSRDAIAERVPLYYRVAAKRCSPQRKYGLHRQEFPSLTSPDRSAIVKSCPEVERQPESKTWRAGSVMTQ